MVIVRLVSGLGNQLFQYAIGRETSLRHNTVLKLDTSFFTSQNLRSYRLDQFNIAAKIADPKEIGQFVNPYRSRSFVRRIRRKFRKIFPLPHTYQTEKNWWGFDETLLNLPDNIYIEGYWQHYKYYERLHSKIKEELTLKQTNPPQMQRLTVSTLGNQLISVHIRRGDYVTDKAASNMGVLPLSYYHTAIDIIKSRISSPVFCFFTDDPDWVKKAFNGLENSVFIEGFQDYEDLSLMSQCHHNIIANSSFSWWGAFLNGKKEKIVICPKQWVIDPTINETIQIQFPSWIKI